MIIINTMFLARPLTVKTTLTDNNLKLIFWKSEMQGWRITMEDSFVADLTYAEDSSLFCIFDGHGGDEVARFCASHFPVEFKLNKQFASKNYKSALTETFLKMDEMLQTENGIKELLSFQKNRTNNRVYSGCTALVIFITGGLLYVANAGDSRCLLFRKNGDIYVMNEEHKPGNSEEGARISKAGGIVLNGRINEILNLSRALGDLEYKQNFLLPPEDQIISGVPDVVVKNIDSDDLFMLIGCDGVYERLSDMNLRNIVLDGWENGFEMQDVLDSILDQTCSPDFNQLSGGYDNMSAILVHFKQENQKPNLD